MIFINLDSLETVNNLVKICDKYDKHYIDVAYGRYTVDGRSVLGVSSLMGKIVKIIPVTDDEILTKFIEKEVTEIGGWIEKTN